MIFQEQAGVLLETRPQIKKDVTRPFYTGIVNIKDQKQYETACQKMRYFTIDGKQCRALQFDRNLLGNNREKLSQNNVFIRNIPKNLSHQNLEDMFSQYGKVKSLKVSLNQDHTSRGYGFICFDNEDAAGQAVENTQNDDQIVAMVFQPKDRRELRKLVNNVYFKNVPSDMKVDEVRKLFEPFGEIKSLVLMKNEIGQYGFVCFDDPKNISKEYGPECANKAIEALNEKEISENNKLFLRPALKKADREMIKKKEFLRYQNSKKRNNLYIRNFPQHWGDAQLHDLFSQYGEIENIRMEKTKFGQCFAFICYKEPDQASNAKQNLNGQNFEDKVMVINHYEIKELRQV
jgi:polyadenylate-binding protein